MPTFPTSAMEVEGTQGPGQAPRSDTPHLSLSQEKLYVGLGDDVGAGDSVGAVVGAFKPQRGT